MMAADQRIVSLISSATEILFLLGLGKRVVGVSHECDFPAAPLARLPRLTRSLIESAAASRTIDDQVRELSINQLALYTIDVEQLARLKPDLIITQAQCDVCAVRYEDVAAAVRDTPALHGAEIMALNPVSIRDVFDDIRQIAAATGAEEMAESVLADLTSRLAVIRQRLAEASRVEIPRVACLEWIEPPMLAANWTPELVQMAGGEPGLTVAGRHSTYANWQQIVDFDPEVVVIMPCGFDLERAIAEAQVLSTFAHWSELSAVRGSRVFAVDGNAYFNRSGPRLVDSVEILAHLFHPDLVPASSVPRAWRQLETRAGALVPV